MGAPNGDERSDDCSEGLANAPWPLPAAGVEAGVVDDVASEDVAGVAGAPNGLALASVDSVALGFDVGGVAPNANALGPEVVEPFVVVAVEGPPVAPNINLGAVIALPVVPDVDCAPNENLAVVSAGLEFETPNGFCVAFVFELVPEALQGEEAGVVLVPKALVAPVPAPPELKRLEAGADVEPNVGPLPDGVVVGVEDKVPNADVVGVLPAPPNTLVEPDAGVEVPKGPVVVVGGLDVGVVDAPPNTDVVFVLPKTETAG